MNPILIPSAYQLDTIVDVDVYQGKKIVLIGATTDTDMVRQQINETNALGHFPFFSDYGNVAAQQAHLMHKTIKEMIDETDIIPIVVMRSWDSELIQHYINDRDQKCALVGRDIMKYAELGYKDYDVYIGAQNHFSAGTELGLDADRIVRLSEVRHDSQKAEAVLRRVKVAIIDLNVLRAADNSGDKECWPTGLTSEELCQVARYIGAGTALNGVIITGIKAENDQYQMTARNIALLCWYICAGFQIRLNELQAPKESFNTYTVVAEALQKEIVFKENKDSGRWWIEIPYDDQEQPLALLPCTRQDYEEACQNHISDKLIRLLSKV